MMRKRINLVIVFYVLYFLWLLMVIMLWVDPVYLTTFLLAIAAFYFFFLYEKYDIWFFSFVYLSSFIIGRSLASDPAFASIGFPPLGIPAWPIAWGTTVLAFRKFYLIISKEFST